MGKRLPFRCPFCDHGFQTESELSEHCISKNHILPSPSEKRNQRGFLMEELLVFAKEECLLESSSHSLGPSSKPSNSATFHPAISIYLDRLSLPNVSSPSATFSSTGNLTKATSSTSSEKRSLSDSYESLLGEFKVVSSDLGDSNDFVYYFLVTLEHQNYLEASRTLCLLTHQRGENILKCRDTNHPYRNRFKVHLGNFKKHLSSCHEV